MFQFAKLKFFEVKDLFNSPDNASITIETRSSIGDTIVVVTSNERNTNPPTIAGSTQFSFQRNGRATLRLARITATQNNQIVFAVGDPPWNLSVLVYEGDVDITDVTTGIGEITASTLATPGPGVTTLSRDPATIVHLANIENGFEITDFQSPVVDGQQFQTLANFVNDNIQIAEVQYDQPRPTEIVRHRLVSNFSTRKRWVAASFAVKAKITRTKKIEVIHHARSFVDRNLLIDGDLVMTFCSANEFVTNWVAPSGWTVLPRHSSPGILTAYYRYDGTVVQSFFPSPSINGTVPDQVFAIFRNVHGDDPFISTTYDDNIISTTDRGLPGGMRYIAAYYSGRDTVATNYLQGSADGIFFEAGRRFNGAYWEIDDTDILSPQSFNNAGGSFISTHNILLRPTSIFHHDADGGSESGTTIRETGPFRNRMSGGIDIISAGRVYDLHNPSAGGSVIIDGQSRISYRISPQISGGTNINSNNIETSNKRVRITGGIDASPLATVRINREHLETASGGIDISDSVTVSHRRSILSTGQMQLGSTIRPSIGRIYPMDGGTEILPSSRVLRWITIKTSGGKSIAQPTSEFSARRISVKNQSRMTGGSDLAPRARLLSIYRSRMIGGGDISIDSADITTGMLRMSGGVDIDMRFRSFFKIRMDGGVDSSILTKHNAIYIGEFDFNGGLLGDEIRPVMGYRPTEGVEFDGVATLSISSQCRLRLAAGVVDSDVGYLWVPVYLTLPRDINTYRFLNIDGTKIPHITRSGGHSDNEVRAMVYLRPSSTTYYDFIIEVK